MENPALVFVRTDAIGMEYDNEIPGIVWNLTPNQRNVQRYINEHSGSTILEIAESVGVEKSTVQRCVNKLIEYDYVKQNGTGKHGAKLYNSTEEGEVDVVVDWIDANSVLDLYTYVAVIHAPGEMSPITYNANKVLTDGSGNLKSPKKISNGVDPPNER